MMLFAFCFAVFITLHIVQAENKPDFYSADEYIPRPPQERNSDQTMAGDQQMGKDVESERQAARRFEAVVVATCTSDCTEDQCTDLCKCKHSHLMVRAVCSPPATSTLATACQKWYKRCYMFFAYSQN